MAGAATSADTYQVTGPVMDLTASTITVQKGDEKWEIARNPEAKGDADLKLGDRVTIYYRMTATRIEAKSAKAASAPSRPSEVPASSATKKK